VGADEGVPYRHGEDGLRETVVSWIVLIVAGLLEVAWASVLPSTEGLTRPAPTVAFLGLLAASMFALAKATESIPLGTAYGVWVGIGAVGAALVGIAAHGDPAPPARLAFLVLLVVAIVGLKLTSGHSA
jgi:quaternary ammonium compound-resistance protein SugE